MPIQEAPWANFLLIETVFMTNNKKAWQGQIVDAGQKVRQQDEKATASGLNAERGQWMM